MKITDNKFDCFGCSSCADICKHKAITMLADSEGFLYPSVDSSLCINCGMCKKICPACNKRSNQDPPKEAYAFKNSSDETRINSSSGGFFTALSDYFLQNNGAVYGSALLENRFARHIRATNADSRNLMRGSKYLQSDMQGIFTQIQKDLDDGRYVLFSGTPCQVHAAKLHFKNHDRLFTVDIICHGVPSPLMWSEFISFSQKKYGLIEKAIVRDTANTWGKYITKFELENGENIYTYDYIKLFSSNNVSRPSCHSCKYTTYSREGDFTMADFWGVQDKYPELFDEKGVSFVYCNSEKALSVKPFLEQFGLFKKANYTDSTQQQLLRPNKPAFTRKVFWKTYKKHGFEKIYKQYVKGNKGQWQKPLAAKILNKLHLR